MKAEFKQFRKMMINLLLHIPHTIQKVILASFIQLTGIILDVGVYLKNKKQILFGVFFLKNKTNLSGFIFSVEMNEKLQ